MTNEDIAVAALLGFLVVGFIVVLIVVAANRSAKVEPEIESLNTLAARPVIEANTGSQKISLYCPRCKAYLGSSVEKMRFSCPQCHATLARPEGWRARS